MGEFDVGMGRNQGGGVGGGGSDICGVLHDSISFCTQCRIFAFLCKYFCTGQIFSIFSSDLIQSLNDD